MTTNLTSRDVRASAHRTGILRPPAAARSAVLALLTIVAVLAGGVLLHASAVDLGVTQAFNAFHVGALAVVTDGVYAVFSPVGAVLLTTATTAVVWVVRRDLRPAAAFAVVVAGTWLPSAVVKLVVHRDRPALALLPHPSPAQVDASYPSGHSVFITVFAIAAVLLLADTRSAQIARVIAPIVVVVVLVSLLVDGVHFPTDVIASVVWALGVAPFVRAVWLRGIAPRITFLR